MARGRKPKPSALKLVTGNPGNRPMNEDEPIVVSPDLPDAPAILTGIALDEWNELAPALYNCGILSIIDKNALAAYCQAVQIWKQAKTALDKMAESDLLTSGLMIKTTNGNFIQNPIVGTLNKAANDMIRFSAEFGLTPSSRTRLSVDKKTPDASPASKYLA